MAQVIRSICDVHLDDQHDGTPTVVAIDGGRPVLIDLCDELRAELIEPLETLLMAHGRSEDGRPLRKARTPRTTPALTDSDGNLMCPEHGRSYKPNLFKDHARKVHHMRAEALMEAIRTGEVHGSELVIDLTKPPAVCEECVPPRTLKNNAGLAAHRRHGHHGVSADAYSSTRQLH